MPMALRPGPCSCLQTLPSRMCKLDAQVRPVAHGFPQAVCVSMAFASSGCVKIHAAGSRDHAGPFPDLTPGRLTTYECLRGKEAVYSTPQSSHRWQALAMLQALCRQSTCA